jgi:hypothetical protein
LSLANAKEKGTNGLVIRSLDDWIEKREKRVKRVISQEENSENLSGNLKP